MKKTSFVITTLLILPILFLGLRLFHQNVQHTEININALITHALQQSMEQDLEARFQKIPHFTHHTSGKTHSEHTDITTYNKGIKKIEKKAINFKSSMALPNIDYLHKQTIAKDLNPIQPDSLLKLFTNELKQLQISAPAGIIYQDEKQRLYSQNDSTGYLRANFVTEIDSFDLSNQLKLTAWVDYGTSSIIRFMNIRGYIGAILCVVSLAIASIVFSCHLLRTKRQAKQNNIPVTEEYQNEPLEENILATEEHQGKILEENTINTEEHQDKTLKENTTATEKHQDKTLEELIILPQTCIAIIDGKQYKLAKKDYGLLHFLMSHIASPQPTEVIQAEFWPTGVIDNVYVHINNLNKILHPHDLDIDKSSAGYQLAKLKSNQPS